MYLIAPDNSRGNSYNRYCTDGYEYPTLHPKFKDDFTDHVPFIVHTTNYEHARVWADRMTNAHVGISFGIYKLEGVVTRPAGALVEKKVSEKGILPA